MCYGLTVLRRRSGNFFLAPIVCRYDVLRYATNASCIFLGLFANYALMYNRWRLPILRVVSVILLQPAIINRLYAFSRHERLLPLTAIGAFSRQTNGPRLDACN